jgi:hypothetical protein
MHKWEQEAFDQAVELSVRIASDIIEQSIQGHISDDDIDKLRSVMQMCRESAQMCKEISNSGDDISAAFAASTAETIKTLAAAQQRLLEK